MDILCALAGIAVGIVIARLIERYTRDAAPGSAAAAVRRVAVSPLSGPGPFRPRQ